MESERGVVLLCVTGSISAYRAADVARELMRSGFGVQCVLTRAAQHFVTPELFTWLTGRPAVHDMFEEPRPGGMAHIDLARQASLFLCAPASAHTLAKMALGLADDLVGAMYLAYHGPTVVAPAMNPSMWDHPAVQANVSILQERGTHFVMPESGTVACGEVGEGKLASVEAIVEEALAALGTGMSMAGLHVVITSGPTREPIDPVRFIGNRSSGKMGHALARAALDRGAKVTLISGPTSLPDPAGADTQHVETAAEMARAAREAFQHCDLFVGAAAVADFRPKKVSGRKIKRGDAAISLSLEPNEDIIAGLAAVKDRQVLVGFAAESDDLVKNARHKLTAKGLDIIVANDITDMHSGFDTDTNRVTLLFKDGRTEELPLLSKREVAERVLDAVIPMLGR
ncbi:MAG: bifunctional phosphopantothenoylcysteine decarboxylase/phosphopantothenate--cysteine ligase CoaBC [Fimbriimonadia bacterium]